MMDEDRYEEASDSLIDLVNKWKMDNSDLAGSDLDRILFDVAEQISDLWRQNDLDG